MSRFEAALLGMSDQPSTDLRPAPRGRAAQPARSGSEDRAQVISAQPIRPRDTGRPGPTPAARPQPGWPVGTGPSRTPRSSGGQNGTPIGERQPRRERAAGVAHESSTALVPVRRTPAALQPSVDAPARQWTQGEFTGVGYMPGAVEQYRRLAGALLHAHKASGARVVMIASALQGEGKSMTASNLAVTLCRSYRRSVLLIDADMRLPSLHQTFRVTNVPGLSDFLDAPALSKPAPVRIAPQLTLLPSGRPTTDPVGGLTSPRMRQLIDEAAERFEWVIIDTPPVTALPDTNLLASMVDAVVLVIAAGETPYRFVTRAIEALGRERILGVVLNRADGGIALEGYHDSSGY